MCGTDRPACCIVYKNRESWMLDKQNCTRTIVVSSSIERSPRVLIVDDDLALLQGLSRAIALRLPEIAVDTSSSAQEALELMRGQTYDAVVSDIKMPGMDGLALLAKIHTLSPQTPTLLITGHGEQDLAIQALRGGAYDYMQKPIDRDSFLAALQRAIQTYQLRCQVMEQQQALEGYARSLECLVQQRTQELAEAHAAKDKVISLVSQELKGPIDRLKEITHLLRQKLGGQEVTEIVDHGFLDIEHAIARTEELVKDLQHTSHIETQMFIPHRQRCDLVSLCRDVLERITKETAVRLGEECLAEPLEIEVDTEQVSYVLHTLLSSTRISAVQDTLTRIMLQKTQQEAIITLRDLGLPAEPGANFYVARKVLEQHGGHLEMQSFPENRRTFFIALPLPTYAASTDAVCLPPRPRIYATWTLT